MTTISVETVQRMIEPWTHAVEARRACRQGTWPAFLEGVTADKRPGWTSFGALRAYKKCLARAAELVDGPRDLELRIYPIWTGDNEDGLPRDDCWFATHCMVAGDGAFGQLETGPVSRNADPSLAQPVVCAARVWTAGNVVQTRAYAPDIQLELRAGDWGVLRSDIIELTAITDVGDQPPAPRPRIDVPTWCSWTEPRVLGLPQPVVDAIRKLSITVDEEGNLVERP